MSYEWMARSDCAVCAAMQGIYEDPPQRPHHRCDCEIMELDWEAGECWVEEVSHEVDMDLDPWLIRLTMRAHVRCPNGREWSSEFDVERDFDQAVFAHGNDSEDAWWLEHDWQHDITEALHDAYATLQLNCSVWVDPTP